MIRGVQNAARARGVRVVLAVSGESLSEHQEQVRQLMAGGIDSLLLMPHPGLSPLDEAERWLSGLEVPVVLVERRAGLMAGRLEQVASDHAYGAALAVRHLAGLGHDRVALVARAESPNTALLSAGYADAVKTMGLTPGPEYRITTSGDAAPVDGRFEEVVRAVEAGEVRAALVHNDIDAIALVGILRARGVRVPEDLALVTYDDEVAELSEVPLTAVAPPSRRWVPGPSTWRCAGCPTLPRRWRRSCSVRNCGCGRPVAPVAGRAPQESDRHVMPYRFRFKQTKAYVLTVCRLYRMIAVTPQRTIGDTACFVDV